MRVNIHIFDFLSWGVQIFNMGTVLWLYSDAVYILYGYGKQYPWYTHKNLWVNGFIYASLRLAPHCAPQSVAVDPPSASWTSRSWHLPDHGGVWHLPVLLS